MKNKNEYLKQWRIDNPDKVREINQRYYLKNKSYLNKSRTNPWMNENIIKWIRVGNIKKITVMLNIIRPEKDEIVGICKK
jgi:hypothetical protein